MEYRVEKKYLCTDYELELLKVRIRKLLPQDAHQDGDCYRIRSVYFDTWNDDCYYENAEGSDARSKYRIRTYNNSDSQIKFEIKQKRNGYIKKESCTIKRAECERLLNGGTMDANLSESTVRNRVILMQRTRLLRPAIIVEYERSAYVLDAGNVRITIDRNISASRYVRYFFEENPRLVPVLEPHMHLLEVKYDEFLPDYVKQALEIGNLQQTSFSKYYLGRQAVDFNDKLVD